MQELRQNKSDLEWPNGLGGEPLPPAIEEWLTTHKQEDRERQEALANLHRNIEKTRKTIDRLKRSVGLE